MPDAFPQRDLLLVCTFAVVLGTLVLQGFTLGPLIRWLKLPEDDSLDGEIRLARAETARAGLDAIQDDPAAEADAFRGELRAKLHVAETDRTGDGRADTIHHALRRRAIAAERERLTTLRKDGSIGDDAYNQLEEELDRAELALTPVVR